MTTYRLEHRQTVMLRAVPAPRMSKRDKWRGAQSPAVQRYVRYCDGLRLRNVVLPDRFKVTFAMRRPESHYSGAPLVAAHMVKPDADNLLKGFLDALHHKKLKRGDDAHIWSVWTEKVWSDEYAIVIEEIIENP